MSDSLFLVESLPESGTLVLDGPEGRHAADVRRVRAGERLLLSDGVGRLGSAVVIAARRGALDLELVDVQRVRRPDPLLVAMQGIAKGDRGELAVQMMTEIGVDEVVPWAAERSVTVWRAERGVRARQRWQATAREAAKQSRRPWIPPVAPAVTVQGASERLRAAEAVLVLHEGATDRISEVRLPRTGTIVVAIGPEGGISDAEVARLRDLGGVPVCLGPTILRTSTAGAAALAVLSARMGRW